MNEETLYLPNTQLRRSYERARSVDHAQQIQECADLLSHPELIVSELLDAYGVIESFGESELDLVCSLERRDPNGDSGELVLDHFYEGQEVSVSCGAFDDFAFRCLATDVRPVPELVPSGDDARDGFDYIAEPLRADALPILAVAQTIDDSSAYPLLLRLLCCLTELAPAKQLTVLNTDRLKGALQADAHFDLHMVLWDEGGLDASQSTLCELSRDLAEAARDGIAETALAARVGRIHCLRMDSRNFCGELEEMWRI
jgi:hypothetical protein